MSNKSFKQIDILRKRREETLLLDPYFIDNKKFIKKGIFFGTSLILTTLFIGIVFIIRTNIFEQRNVPNIFVSSCFLKSLVGKYSTGPKVAIPALFISADSVFFPR